MRKLVFVVLMLALLATACAGAEVRGAWITSWESGFITPQEVDATIAAAKKAGLNALYIEVRKFADAYYYSRMEPRDREIPAGFDPLGYTIKKAHAEGMQVHAWVVVYRAWCGAKTGPTDPNHVVNKHPDWVMLSKDGKNWAGEGIYLDPGVPEAREYIASIFEDIVKRYNVDGIQYDYIRYPGKTWGYSEAALKHYYADTGAKEIPASDDPKWLQWRRDQVTALAKLAHDKIKAVAPNCVISASTICYGGSPGEWEKTSPYASVLQDWYKWMQLGYLDVNIPMNYKSENRLSQWKSFRDWIALSEKWSAGRPVYQGIYLDENTAPDALKQIAATRKAGQEGFVLFSFNAGKRRDAIVDVLGAGLGPAPKLPVNEPLTASSKE